MQIRFIPVAVAFAATSFFMSCEEESDATPSFEVKEMLANTGQTILVPATEDFVTHSQELVTKASTLKDQADLAAFTAFRKEWFACMDSWQRVQIVNFGEISKKYYDISIGSWPANAFFIDQNIQGTEEINRSYIDGKGGSSKGLLAIEYIAFDRNKTDEEIFNSLSERHFEYIYAIADNNLFYAQKIKEYWANNTNSFSENTDNGIDGSVSLMVNQMVRFCEVMGKNKVGRQAGLYGSTITSPTGVECYHSAYSYQSILEGTKVLQQFFNGDLTNQNERLGLDDYINRIEGSEDLSTEINAQFEIIINMLESRQSNLSDDINQDFAKAKELYEAFKVLTTLIKTDLSSMLSVTVLPTDVDGD